MTKTIRTVDKETGLKLYCETEMEKYRCDSFHDKEPETIEWIRSFKPGETIYDIGANIGVYTCYAALRNPTSLVYAFEPVPANYYRLLDNCRLNKIGNVIPLMVGMSDRCDIERLNIRYSEVGASGAQLGTQHDDKGEFFYPETVHKVMTMTVDSLTYTYNHASHPAHIKIDVDGRESSIIEGMRWTLQHPDVRSVLLEVNHGQPGTQTMLERFAAYGWTHCNRFNKMSPHSRERRGGNPENIVFTRG